MDSSIFIIRHELLPQFGSILEKILLAGFDMKQARMVDMSVETAAEFGEISKVEHARNVLNGKAIVLELAKSDCIPELKKFTCKVSIIISFITTS